MRHPDPNYARLQGITAAIAAEELQRVRDWERERADALGGFGVTPGAPHPDEVDPIQCADGDVCDFVPDTSILGQDTNPKQLAPTRDKKAPLQLLEHAAEVEIAAALGHGATKYGRRNFREIPILATVYVGAIRRHIGAWADGEDIDPESGLSHLAHIGANIHVLFAAMAAGTFTDDRGPESQSDVQARLSAASNGARP